MRKLNKPLPLCHLCALIRLLDPELDVYSDGQPPVQGGPFFVPET